MKVYNITPRILELSQRKLLLQPNNPLAILKNLVFKHFEQIHPNTFAFKDDFDPKVTVK